MEDNFKMVQIENKEKIFDINEPKIKDALDFLKDCFNFEGYLKELKDNPLKTKLFEINTAYLLKKVCGFKVGFLPDNEENCEIIPSYESKSRIYNNTKKPDLFVVIQGKMLFVEVKSIGEDYVKKIMIRRIAGDDSRGLEERLLNLIKASYKKTKNFGGGIAAIYFPNSPVFIDNIKNKIEKLFKQSPKLFGVILFYASGAHLSGEFIVPENKYKILINKNYKDESQKDTCQTKK